jgi:hypothetical protein
LRYAPPGGKPLHIRLSPGALEMVEALRSAPASRFELMKRRPRLGLSGPQAIERLRKAGIEIESEWLKGEDRTGRPVRFVRYCLRGRVLGVSYA